jgi:anti-repressor protein
MNELIPINYEGDAPTVNGRELHAALGVETRYNDWFPRMCEYGFSEGTDYYSFLSNGDGVGKAATRTDHALTIPMAKEIAMIQRTDKGKQIRQYLIRLEDAWNTPEMVMSRALKMADGRIRALQSDNSQLTAQIEADRPKVLFADAVSTSDSEILIGELAKILRANGVNIGQNRLFEKLRQDGYLIKRKGTDYNAPTQRSMELGLFRVKETAITHADGHVTVSKTTKVTGKGQLYFVSKFRQGEATSCPT